jgi:acyl-coenzyme A thioesterase 13
MPSITPVQPLQQKISLQLIGPFSLPKYGDASTIGGNAPDFIKQLVSNTYGVGDETCFAHSIERVTEIIAIDILENKDGGYLHIKARTVAQLVVFNGRFAENPPAGVAFNPLVLKL